MLKQIRAILVYTDGSCDMNPGHIGAWCFLITENNKIQYTKSSAKIYTNKITSILMELKAFYMAIYYIHKTYKKDKNTIYTDCMYIVNIYNNIHMPKAHIKIWKKIFKLKRKNISVLWIKGHNKCEENLMADKLAKDAMLNLKSLQ